MSQGGNRGSHKFGEFESTEIVVGKVNEFHSLVWRSFGRIPVCESVAIMSLLELVGVGSKSFLSMFLVSKSIGVVVH